MIDVLFGALRAFITFGVLMSIVPMIVLAERRIAALIQNRVGPNRVGPGGLLQPFADVLKLLFKEEITPSRADRVLYSLGPLMAFAPVAIAFAAIPVGRGLQVADISVGVLFVVAVTSLGVYGISFGGWASNSKYSLLGALRSSAQIISYEIAMSLALISLLMTAGSLDLQEIVASQRTVFHWNIFWQPVAFILFAVAGFAETNRLPFDLPECEAELVGGFHTEYSSLKFALFFLGEYIAIIVMSSLIVTLFLGGWQPGVFALPDGAMGTVLSVLVFAFKVAALVFFFIWVRWTLPRFRYDQLMRLSWKGLIPLAMANILVTGVVVTLWDAFTKTGP
jgi:NADH-quinone oxidoreductase subunit H